MGEPQEGPGALSSAPEIPRDELWLLPLPAMNVGQ